MLNTPSLIAMFTSKRTQPLVHTYTSEEAAADAKLQGLFEAVLAEELANTNDRHKSDEGQRATSLGIGQRTLANLDWFVRLQAVNTKTLARVKKETFAFLSPAKDESDTQALRREIRADRILANVDDGHGANAAFLRALERGDATGLAIAVALLDDPNGSLVSDDIRDRGAREYVARTNPEALKTLDAFEHLATYFTDTINALAMWLPSFGLQPNVIRQGLHLPPQPGDQP